MEALTQEQFETIRGQIAQQILAEWKADDGTLLEKYGGLSAFAVPTMAKSMFENHPAIVAEFQDVGVLESFLANDHRASSHTSKTQRYTKEDVKQATKFEGNPDTIKALFESSKELQEEFGDLETYRAFRENEKCVKTLNK